jgi:hypothetical protein
MSADAEFLHRAESLVRQTHEFVGILHRILSEENNRSTTIDIDTDRITTSNLEIARIIADWRTKQATDPAIMRFE